MRRQIEDQTDQIAELRLKLTQECRESLRWKRNCELSTESAAVTEQELDRVKMELKSEIERREKQLADEEKEAGARTAMRVKRTWHLNRAGLEAKVARLKERISSL